MTKLHIISKSGRYNHKVICGKSQYAVWWNTGYTVDYKLRKGTIDRNILCKGCNRG